MFYLPHILAILTQRPRHKVDAIEWSKTSWTYNLFRVWEMLFWRKCGKRGVGDTIRYESSLTTFKDIQSGKTVAVRDFGTWESLVVHIESVIRAYFTLPKISFEFVPAQQLALTYGYTNTRRSLYRFAIAFDSAQIKFDNAGIATSFSTANLTCTGSNLLLATNVYWDLTGGVTISNVQYNSVSSGTSATTVSGSFASESLYKLVAPASGSALPVVVTTSAVIAGNKQIGIVAQSYSGCKQTSQPDSANSAQTSADTTSNFGVSTTVVASNCWLVGGAQDDFGGTIGSSATPGSGTTYRGTLAGNLFGADSNGTVGTGGQSLNWGKTTASGYCTGNVMSIAPSVAATNTGNFLMFM